MKTRIFVDGRITEPERAVVPVLDRGFLYGDSVYEVLWWHRGALVQQADHLARLRRSAQHVYMDITLSDEAMVEAMHRTCEAAQVAPDDDAYVRLIVTRGSGPLGLDPTRHEAHHLVVIVSPANRPSAETWERGLRMAIVERRRNAPRALDPSAKTGNYLNNVLALHEARLAGADDALMLNAAGEVTEATTANVYLVTGGVVRTPPLDAGILEGTTRRRILALCAANGIPTNEQPVTPRDAKTADEVFVSSSVRGILPVVRIDDHEVGDGRPGPLTRRLDALFVAAADREAAGRAAADREAAERDGADAARDVR